MTRLEASIRQLGETSAPVTERLAAVAVLASNPGDPRAVEGLCRALEDVEPEIRAAAARALGELKAAAALSPLCRALRDGDDRVCRNAAWALGELRDPEAVEALELARADPSAPVRLAAERGLEKIRRGSSPPPAPARPGLRASMVGSALTAAVALGIGALLFLSWPRSRATDFSRAGSARRFQRVLPVRVSRQAPPASPAPPRDLLPGRSTYSKNAGISIRQLRYRRDRTRGTRSAVVVHFFRDSTATAARPLRSRDLLLQDSRGAWHPALAVSDTRSGREPWEFPARHWVRMEARFAIPRRTQPAALGIRRAWVIVWWPGRPEPGDAVEVLARLTPADRETPIPSAARAAVQRARRVRASGDGRPAEAAYRQALRILPHWTAVRVELADLYQEQGRWREARQQLRRAQAFDPNDGALLHALARLHLAADSPYRDPTQAVALADRARSWDPADVHYRVTYAEARFAYGDPELALAEIIQAMGWRPDDPQLRRLRQKYQDALPHVEVIVEETG